MLHEDQKISLHVASPVCVSGLRVHHCARSAAEWPSTGQIVIPRVQGTNCFDDVVSTQECGAGFS